MVVPRRPDGIETSEESDVVELGRFGVWTWGFRGEDHVAVQAAAAELERLGYTTLWLPGGVGGDVFGPVRTLLEATQRAVVATGILNIWMHEPDEVARGFADVENGYPGRFLLGLGVSHQFIVDREEPGRYQRPLEKMRTYLDALDAADPPVRRERRVLAALGPRMLQLARERSGGAHPYNVTPEHTRRARDVLGPDRLLAPEQMVVLERDADRAREIARGALAIYLRAPNYVRNWFRLGFTEDDVAGGRLSDRLVDALVAWGSPEDAARRLREHLDAGGDHVCVQMATASGDPLPLDDLRALAGALEA